MSPSITAQMEKSLSRGQHPASLLSGREKEVLEQVIAGKTNQEIGWVLGISEKTVEKHLKSTYMKLGVDSRVEAAMMVVREGWK